MTSISKFDSELAENLYGETADEEIAPEGQGTWCGLYRVERVILVETSQGFVYSLEYDSTDELEAAWQEVLDNGESLNYD